MALDVLLSIPKEDIPSAAEALSAQDIAELVDVLNDKADVPRYQALLLLTARSERFPDVQPHWQTFRAKLSDANSYQRTIGMLMIAENARWAKTEEIEECLDGCLKLILDEKPITARQAIQVLPKIALAAPGVASRIANALMGLDLMNVRETMRKLILLDACRALLTMRRIPDQSEPIDAFLMTALSGDILDKAAKKEIQTALKK